MMPQVVRLGSWTFIRQPRALRACLLLMALMLGLATVLLGTGTLPLSAHQVLGSLLGWSDSPVADRVVWRVRLPRVLTAVCVGAALGAAGSIFQSISRNALGSPDIIGFTTGAASGAIAQIILFDAGPLGTSLAAVIAGVCTAAVVLLLARKQRSTGGYRLVLVGIGVGATLSGLNTVLLVIGNLDQAMSAQLWLAGSLNTRTWAHVAPAAAGLLVIMPLAAYNTRQLNLLEMGDDTASQLGVDVERTRLTLVMAAVALTAIATAAAGPISFIALAAPQLARRLTLAPGVPLVSGALLGAVLLLAADGLGQRLSLHMNLPVGLTTGVLGGGYLLWLLARQSKA